jgi:hypothetical protein
MEDLFTFIGKLYVDVYNMQRVIEVLQKKLKESESSGVNRSNTPVEEQDER